MQLPVFPPTGQVHSPPGPHTIGCGGAASPMTAQSASVLHGSCGAAQIPQPAEMPPGVHPYDGGQSAFEWHVVAPASAGQEIPSAETAHFPPLHDADTLHP
jgi:hypothetical protein